MLILTPDQRYQFHGREGSPSDALVVKETWVENVYQIHPNDVQDTKVLVDVGANIGAVSVFGASLGAKVIAVEPEPDNLTYLHTNLKVNRFPGSVRVAEVAVAPEPGTVNFTPEHGHSRIDTNGPVQVEAKRLEDILADYQITYADVLKIDIEGHEYPVIDSTPADVLRKFAYITVEFDNTTDTKFGKLVTKLAHHFGIQVLGSPGRGGYIYARRYD